MISKVINGTEQNVAGNGGGTNDYEALTNLPQINGNELTGDQTGADLGLVDAEEGNGIWKTQGEYGVKNLIPYPWLNGSGSKYDVDFTDNSDGTISANGTASYVVNYSIITPGSQLLYLKAGYYILSGCVGGSSSTYELLLTDSNGNMQPRQYDDEVKINIISDGYYGVKIVVREGITVNNVLFKPMLRSANDTDKTYHPYAKTNKQLTDEISGNASDIDEIDERLDNTTTAVTGNPISISGLKSNQLAKNPIITFEPIQAGSGDPSPSNVRAISGYDKIEVLSTGKNLIDCPNVSLSTAEYAISAYDCKTITGSGHYVFSFNYEGTAGTQANLQFFASDMSSPVYDIVVDLVVGLNLIDAELNGQQKLLYFFVNGTGNFSNFQLEKGQTATTFELYNPVTNIQLILGQTIYGGTLDLEKGILTVDRGFWTYTGDEEWIVENDGKRLACTTIMYGVKAPADGGSTTNLKCNMFQSISPNQTWTGVQGISVNIHTYGDQTLVSDGSGSMTVEAWKTYLASNNMQVAYELETPFTIQLTPHEISLLKDYAYVSTNGTNMSFSYKNGEVASLADVESLGKTVNLLGTETDLQIGNLSSHTPNNISSRLNNLITAVSEQNLEKYGYKIGDYFMGTSQVSNNFRYWLADMDTFYGGYDYYAVESVHHIGIVVDTMQSSQWYTSSDITDVGYNQSTLHSYLSGSALDIIKADMIALFGGSTGLEHLLGHTKLWNKLETWYWSDENTHSQYIAALTECQLAGAKIWSADNYQQGEGHKQLNLFVKYCFNQIFGWTRIWLRSIASSGLAVYADDTGFVNELVVTFSARAAGLILFH